MPPQPLKKLPTPQARVLRALLPPDGAAQWTWPTLLRFQLAEAAGFTPTAGTINRALNGVPEGSSSGESHLGLVALGFVARLSIFVDGPNCTEVEEIAYQITPAGIAAYRAHIAKHNVPDVRPRENCINTRYTNVAPRE